MFGVTKRKMFGVTEGDVILRNERDEESPVIDIIFKIDNCSINLLFSGNCLIISKNYFWRR